MAVRRKGAVITITTLLLDGREARLEWSQDGETYRYRFESEIEKSAEVREVEPGVYSVVAGGRSFEVRVDGGNVSACQRSFCVEVVDPRRWNRDRNHRQADGVQVVAASMPGKVVRVLVSPGDLVEAGQGLIVVEAMKMQNELKAVRPGLVATMTAAPGDTVNAGEILATIE